MSLKDIVFEAGIVGCGGAGFPTHVKLSNNAEYLIVNAAECEPVLANDRYLLRQFAPEILRAATAMAEQIGAKHCVICTKSTYTAEVQSVRDALSQYPSVELHLLESFYPAGDEFTITFEVTGKPVPPGGLPMDCGAVISNVGTVYAVSQAMEGKPFTHRYVTVSGKVASPCVVYVPVGTSLAQCIAMAGGVTVPGCGVIKGGPMMGKYSAPGQWEKESVSKTTSGILVVPCDSKAAIRRTMPLDEIRRRAASACTQCSYCTGLCPRHLMGSPIEPHKVMRAFGHCSDIRKLLEDPSVRNTAYCCECGVCSVFACPMGLQPTEVNAMFRQELRNAGIRPEKRNADGVSPERDIRKIPSHRLAARAGVSDYTKNMAEEAVCVETEKVSLSLRQSAGAPSEPVVTVGTRVKCGDLVARCPEGSLGANLHASLDGIVTNTEEHIDIEREAVR